MSLSKRGLTQAAIMDVLCTTSFINKDEFTNEHFSCGDKTTGGLFTVTVVKWQEANYLSPDCLLRLLLLIDEGSECNYESLSHKHLRGI